MTSTIGSRYEFSVNELELVQRLLSLTEASVDNRRSFAIASYMWDSGHNSIVIPIIKYMLFSDNTGNKGYLKNKPEEVKTLIYKYLAYASYQIRREGSAQSVKKDSPLYPHLKARLPIKEFDDKNRQIYDARTINEGARIMMNFLRNGKVNENKTESSWKWHFNHGQHPSYFYSNTSFEDKYTPEQKKELWNGIVDRDKDKLSAGVDFFMPTTQPDVVFMYTSDPKKFDAIIADLLSKKDDHWVEFVFKCEDDSALIENIIPEKTNGRTDSKELLILIIDHILYSWSKSPSFASEKVYKPTDVLNLRNVSDYEVLAVNKNLRKNRVKCLSGDAIDWKKVPAPIVFRFKSPYIGDGKMHAYRFSIDGLEKID
ncbi:MAG: hypothetical protein MJ238_04745 [Bacilli bacterium]|nr:hypothetical protein [Bacilli bacterium]